MGIVYLAEDAKIQRLVAIKTIQFHHALSPEQQQILRDRFLREARAAGALSHPSIVTIFHVGDDQGRPYIVMEFIDGSALEDLLTKPDFWRDAFPHGMLDIARALDHAHSKAIVHRDIKPGNILVAKNGAFKVSDFGIAKVLNESLSTLTSGAIGTPNHMSPEQIRGGAIDGRSDQFALGIVAYRILTGRMPFTGETPAIVCYRIVNEPFILPSAIDPRFHHAVDAAIQRALAKDPAWRYPSCAEFVTALNAAIALKPAPNAPPVQPAEPADSGLSLKPIILMAAGLFVLVILGAAIVFFRPDPNANRQIHEQTIDIKPIDRSDSHTKPPPDITPNIQTAENGSVNSDPATTSDPAKTQEAAPNSIPQPRPVRIIGKDQQKYAWIPPGTFGMGCPKSECQAEELRRHPVNITQGFWIGQTEVTAGAYKRYTQSTGRAMPEETGSNPGWKDDLQPIGNVTWSDAAAFCAWSGGRLPTEAEWEYAARAGTAGQTYGPLDNVAWYYKTGAAYSAAHEHQAPRVGLKQPNAFALYDMLGNVREWVADFYDENYYKASPASDPRGPASGDKRSVRSSHWLDQDYYTWVWWRHGSPPDYRSQDLGFRCASSAPGP